MPSEPTNAERTTRAQAALRAYWAAREDEPDDDVLRDLLTDLRHYADANGIDFWKEDASASVNHYIETH